MGKLSELPVELMPQVANYLNFLDRRVFSSTSGQCRALTGVVECPDEISRLAHLCRILPYSLTDLKLSRPTAIMECLGMFNQYFTPGSHWDHTDLECWKYRDACRPRPIHRSSLIEQLLLPY